MELPPARKAGGSGASSGSAEVVMRPFPGVRMRSSFIRCQAFLSLKTGGTCRRHLLSARSKIFWVIASFNAFLMRDGKFKKAKDQIAELLRYCSGESSVAISCGRSSGVDRTWQQSDARTLCIGRSRSPGKGDRCLAL